MIEGQPTWAGTGREAVLAWIHAPEDGTSRGIVVLGPPAGREQVLSMLAVRRLAVLLARRGYTAVRLFWRGTSDSQPLYGDPDLVGCWQDDVRTVIAHVRQSCGLSEAPVHAIGYRVGAAVLGSMAEELDTVVAWEPVSGGAFVRQWTRMRAALASSTPQREDERDLIGLILTPAQAESLSGLSLPGGERIHDFKEKDRRRAKAMYAVEPFDTHLHDDVFETLMGLLPGGSRRLGARPSEPVLESTWSDEQGVRLHERLVEVGPEPRIGIVTWSEGSLVSEPGARSLVAGAARSRAGRRGADLRGADLRFSAPGLIVSGGGPDGRAGGGEWPAAARELAADGFVVLRCDRPLVADSTPVDELRASNSYTLRSAIGLQDMVEWLRDRGCPQVHAGLHCASAWAACLGELEGRPVRADSTVLLGHAEWKMDPQWWAGFREVYDADIPAIERSRARSAYLGVVDEPADPGVEDQAPERGPLRSLGAIAVRRLRERDLRGLKGEVRPEIVRWMRYEMPYPLWLRLNRMGRMTGPESVLEPMASRQPVIVVNGPDDYERWEQTRADRAVQQLARRGLPISEQRLEHMDHSLLTSEARRQVTAVLRSSLPVLDRIRLAEGARAS